MPVRNGQRCCSATEQLQDALQNHCKVTGCSNCKFWLLNAAMSSRLTALNNDFTAAKTFYEITTSAGMDFKYVKNVFISVKNISEAILGSFSKRDCKV